MAQAKPAMNGKRLRTNEHTGCELAIYPTALQTKNTDNMEIESVVRASESTGWIVTANKCRPHWRERVENAGHKVTTIFGTRNGGSVRIIVRRWNGLTLAWITACSSRLTNRQIRWVSHEVSGFEKPPETNYNRRKTNDVWKLRFNGVGDSRRQRGRIPWDTNRVLWMQQLRARVPQRAGEKVTEPWSNANTTATR